MARSCQKDLKKFKIDERWYQLAQDRSGWRRSGRTGLEDVAEARVAEDERRKRTRVEDSFSKKIKLCKYCTGLFVVQ